MRKVIHFILLIANKQRVHENNWQFSVSIEDIDYINLLPDSDRKEFLENRQQWLKESSVAKERTYQ